MHVVMTLTFFFNVSDTGAHCSLPVASYDSTLFTGSWLEIGQTISFFCISSLLLVWSAGICTLGEWLWAPSRVHSKRANVKPNNGYPDSNLK